MIRIAALFLWLIVPIGLWWVYATYGTPHLVLTYRFFDNGDIYNPLARRRYIDCDYLGIHGWITASAINENCPWVRFFKVGF